MFNEFYSMIRTKVKYFNNEPEVYKVIVEEDMDYTDEIEKALWDLKEPLDVPTEEIEIAVASRHKSLNTE